MGNVLPSAEVVEKERQEKGLLADVNTFNRQNLKQTEVAEKVQLPDSETIKKERMEHDILKSVNLFNRENLKPTDTVEKKLSTGCQRVEAGKERVRTRKKHYFLQSVEFEEKQHGREKCSSRRPRSGQGAARARVAQRGRGFRQIGAEKGRNRGEELSP